MAYRSYAITVSKDDEAKAEAIISKHVNLHNLYDYEVEVRHESDGTTKLIYRVKPIISDDLEIVKADLVRDGVKLF